MIEISTTATFDRLFDKLHTPIRRKAASKTDLFKRNPFPHHEVWSFRVDRAYRVIFKFVGPNQAELRYIGHHHSIYDYDMFR